MVCLLREQLGVGRDYNTWIKQQIDDIGLEEEFDYKIDTPLKVNQKGRGGDRRSIGYNIKVSTAKEIAMVAGAKGGMSIIILAFPKKEMTVMLNCV